MTKKRIVADVSDERHRQYHLAARFVGRTISDIVIELLDGWSDGVLRATSLADVIAATASKENEETV